MKNAEELTDDPAFIEAHDVFSATCLAIGFMVSPLSMPVVGNGAGVLGYGLLWVLPVAALLNFFTVNRYFTSLKREIFCRCDGKNEGQGI